MTPWADQKSQIELWIEAWTNLSIKGAAWMTEVLSVAQNKARKDLLLLNSLQPQFEVFTRPSIIRLHIIWQETQHLHHMLQEALGAEIGNESIDGVEWQLFQGTKCKQSHLRQSGWYNNEQPT